MQRSLSRLAIEREGNTRLVKASCCNDRKDKDVENVAVPVIAFVVSALARKPAYMVTCKALVVLGSTFDLEWVELLNPSGYRGIYSGAYFIQLFCFVTPIESK